MERSFVFALGERGRVVHGAVGQFIDPSPSETDGAQKTSLFIDADMLEVLDGDFRLQNLAPDI